MRRALSRSLLWAPLALLGGCREQAAPPLIERADVTALQTVEAPREAMLRERSGAARILADARDAWTVPIGGSALIELPPSADPRFDSAAGIVVLGGGPRTGRVRLESRLETAMKLEWQAEIDLAEPGAIWRDVVLAPNDGSRGARLRVSASWIGTPPAGAERVRAAFAVPRRARAYAKPMAGAPNVLLITVDSLRADRLGCYGHARPTSPRIDALAAGGARFAQAYSSAPWTLPSYGSLFTGLLPGVHRAGVVTERDALFGIDRDAPEKTTTEVLRADVPTLAEQFLAAGFATAMFHANPYLSRATGLDRGFQRYVRYETNARNGVDLALGWIEEQRAAPWFLVVHLMDPHFPYAPPAPFDERFAERSVEAIPDWPPNLAEMRRGRPSDEVARLASDLYDGEIAFTDEQIGRLLDGLAAERRLANTIVVLHSDHGEEFWEHGGADHGHAQHEELLRVPLVLAWPGQVPAGRVVESRVRALDLFATLLDLTGVAVPPDVESRTLRPLFAGDEPPRRTIAEAIHGGAREIKAILEGDSKLVLRGVESRLHDLAVDPGESTDLAPEASERVEALRALIYAHHGRSREAARHARALEFDAAERARLGQLGYGGTDETPPK